MRAISLLAVMLSSVGCTSLSPVSFGPFGKFAEPTQRDPVTEIVCLWESAEGQDMNNLPCRGFAGQLLFFTNGRDEPVKVNGKVRVYVFDDQGPDGDPSKPIHQFDFPAPAWNAFLYRTNLGPAYQLFIPYTRKGGHHAECSLRVRYTPEDGGPPVYSQMAAVVLPGRPRPAEASAAPGTPAATVADPAASADQSFPGVIEGRRQLGRGGPLPRKPAVDQRDLDRLKAVLEDTASSLEEDDPPLQEPRRFPLPTKEPGT